MQSAIADLLADPCVSVLDLPRMTTGQRKIARKFIAEQPGLVCENVGLGRERRLRAIKLEASDGSEPQCLAKEEEAAGEVESSDQLGEGFDVEATIAEFLADTQQTTFELPHMSTEQRKLAKKLVEGLPELKCESYGLGAGRRLHVFKSASDTGAEGLEPALKHLDLLSPSSLAAHVFNVKNTFIDGFAAEDRVESTVFRSTPVWLREGDLQRHLSEPHEGPQGTCGGSVEIPCSEHSGGELVDSETADKSPTCEVQGEVSLVGSTTASHCSSPRASDSVEGTPQSLPQGFHIQNTFICGSAGESLDTRIVRSMPHGMFKQCLLEESYFLEASNTAERQQSPESTGTVGDASGAEAPAAEPSAVLAPGTEVVIHGLTKLPAFNGLAGTVQCFDKEAGRYDILLPSPVGESRQRWAKVKREHLSAAAQPQPPVHAPKLALETAIIAAVGSQYPAASIQQEQFPPFLAGTGTQTAGFGGLVDIGSCCSTEAGIPLFCSQEWSWLSMGSIPTWEIAPLPASR